MCSYHYNHDFQPWFLPVPGNKGAAYTSLYLRIPKSDKADKVYFSTTRNLHKVKYVFTQLELNSLV